MDEYEFQKKWIEQINADDQTQFKADVFFLVKAVFDSAFSAGRKSYRDEKIIPGEPSKFDRGTRIVVESDTATMQGFLDGYSISEFKDETGMKAEKYITLKLRGLV